MTVPFLLPADCRCLEDRGLAYEVAAEAGMTCVVIRSWRLPTGYDRADADLLIRLPAGFPDVAMRLRDLIRDAVQSYLW